MSEPSDAECEAMEAVMCGHDMNQRAWIDHGWRGAHRYFLPLLKHECEDAGVLQLEVDELQERIETLKSAHGAAQEVLGETERRELALREALKRMIVARAALAASPIQPEGDRAPDSPAFLRGWIKHWHQEWQRAQGELDRVRTERDHNAETAEELAERVNHELNDYAAYWSAMDELLCSGDEHVPVQPEEDGMVRVFIDHESYRVRPDVAGQFLLSLRPLRRPLEDWTVWQETHPEDINVGWDEPLSLAGDERFYTAPKYITASAPAQPEEREGT